MAEALRLMRFAVLATASAVSNGSTGVTVYREHPIADVGFEFGDTAVGGAAELAVDGDEWERAHPPWDLPRVQASEGDRT
jgi:hypothetical protein